MAAELTFPKAVSCHAWNKDRTMCAVVHNDSDVIIYGNCDVKDFGAWTVKYTLDNHDHLVSGLDWSPVHNKIVTASHDRNSFVFTYDSELDKWVAGLVLLRLPRGCTGATWSPDGDKFIVTSAYKEVRVCTFDPDNDWWCGAGIYKADKGTVMAAAWHPNSQIVATGSGRKVCRVFSAYSEDTDDTQDAGPFAEGEAFGVNIIDFDADGWVEACAWSPDGYSLAFTAHDSTLYVVTFAEDGTSAPRIQPIKEKTRPHTLVMFTSEKSIVAAGHEMAPVLYKRDSDGIWAMSKCLDKKTVQSSGSSEAGGRTASARSMFAARATLGTSDKKQKPVECYKHRHSIADMRVFESKGAKVTKISTVCTGGKMVVWSL